MKACVSLSLSLSPSFLALFPPLFPQSAAKKIQPDHDPRLTFDALMLGTTCNLTRPTTGTATTATTAGNNGAPAGNGAAAAAFSLGSKPWSKSCDVYVAVDGSDTNSGRSPASALKTVAAGVVAARKTAGPRALCVGQWPY